jgi:hypothetical protein
MYRLSLPLPAVPAVRHPLSPQRVDTPSHLDEDVSDVLGETTKVLPQLRCSGEARLKLHSPVAGPVLATDGIVVTAIPHQTCTLYYSQLEPPIKEGPASDVKHIHQ